MTVDKPTQIWCGIFTYTVKNPHQNNSELEPERGIEPLTYALRVRCSTD